MKLTGIGKTTRTNLRNWNVALGFLGTLPMIVTLVVLPSLPDKVPAHYGMNGQVDRWGGKYEGLVLPVICIVFAVAWIVLERFVGGEVEDNGSDSRGTVRIFIIGGICALALFNIMNGYIIWSSFNKITNLNKPAISMTQITNIGLGLTLVMLGNVLPQGKPNGLSGVRLPGAYASREAWRRCQRFGGIAFIVDGVLMVIAGLLIKNDEINNFILFGILLITLPIVYAYSEYAARKYGNIGGPIYDENGEFVEDTTEDSDTDDDGKDDDMVSGSEHDVNQW